MITASAPATLMICGEHSVVYGHSAIVCAVNSRLKVSLTPRHDQQVVIASALGEHQTDLDHLSDHPQLRFLLQALREETPSYGVNIAVTSDINPTMGLGSSAAVIIATLAALRKLNGKENLPAELHAAAMNVLLAVQKRGSGADLAAAITGGMIAYQRQKSDFIRPLPLPPTELSLRYAGYKTPTAEVLALVAEKGRQHPEKYQNLYQQMGLCTENAVQAAAAGEWSTFYQYLDQYQTLMEALGVCDAEQKQQIAEAKSHAWSAKISGSGLGDCIIAFSDHLPKQHFPVVIDSDGVLL